MKFPTAILITITSALPALAGPPLICHTYSIGKEVSLPQGGDQTSWNNPDPAYNTRALAADTLRLLDPGKPLLFRMETLRRAAVYSWKNPQAGLQLAAQLMARAVSAELKSQGDSLALFDAGYFIESLKQLAAITKVNLLPEADGYEWVKRSLPGVPDRLAAEYALGLIQAHSAWPNEHMRRAVAGAQEGTLLAENLVKHFQNQSLASVKKSVLVTLASGK